jgi:hypothetical protein
LTAVSTRAGGGSGCWRTFEKKSLWALAYIRGRKSAVACRQLYTIAVILIVLWLLGLVSPPPRAASSVLLVIAVVVILLRVIGGRKAI